MHDLTNTWRAEPNQEQAWEAYARRKGGRWTAGPYYFQTTRKWRRANRKFMVSLKEFLARQSQTVPETIASQFKETYK